ncbi:hypothetical protein Plhal703r1_c04g0022151 [Plasmopara halstedii]
MLTMLKLSPFLRAVALLSTVTLLACTDSVSASNEVWPDHNTSAASNQTHAHVKIGSRREVDENHDQYEERVYDIDEALKIKEFIEEYSKKVMEYADIALKHWASTVYNDFLGRYDDVMRAKLFIEGLSSEDESAQRLTKMLRNAQFENWYESDISHEDLRERLKLNLQDIKTFDNPVWMIWHEYVIWRYKRHMAKWKMQGNIRPFEMLVSDHHDDFNLLVAQTEAASNRAAAALVKYELIEFASRFDNNEEILPPQPSCS